WSASSSSSSFGRGRVHGTRPSAPWAPIIRPPRLPAGRGRPLDPPRRMPKVRTPVAALRLPGHGAQTLLLLAGALRDLVLRVLDRVVVLPHRTDIETPGTAGIDPHSSKDGLPDHEGLLGLQAGRLLLGAGRPDDLLEMPGEVRESVGRGMRGAARLVQPPLKDGVARTGKQAAPAALAETE